MKYWFGDVIINVGIANDKKGKSITLIKKFINKHSISYRDIQV